MSEIEDPSKEGTEIYYPDSDGPVKAGLPSDPSARPAGYKESNSKTGIDYGVAADDLPESGRRTLGDWLANRTSNNITPVPSGVHPADAVPTVVPVVDENTFVKSSDVGTVYSHDDAAPANTTVMDYGPKGNANTYLRDFHPDGNNNAGSSYLNPQNAGGANPALGDILARNRFRPGASFPTSGRDKHPWAAPQKFNNKGDLGDGTLGKYYSTDYDGLTVDELGRIAEHLMLNAVGDTETGFGDRGAATTNLGNQGSFGFQGILLTKTPTQLGGNKIDANDKFRAANALGVALSGDRTQTENIAGTMATEDDPLAINATESFGVLNNHLEKFGAALPTSMILLAAVAALTILVNVLIIALLLDVLGLIAAVARKTLTQGGGLNPKPTYHVYGGDGTLNTDEPLPMGAAFGEDDFTELGFFDQLYKYLGIPPLDGNYPGFIPMVTAALFGTLEFFIGNSLNGGGAGSRVPQILTNAAGYYTVVTRNAIRDAEQITEAAAEMDGSFVGAIEGFFSLIDAFRSSATFRFSMVMVTIGDKIVSGQGMTGNRDNGGMFGLPKNLEGSAPMVISNLHKTIRINPDETRLSYSFTALPQVYLRPSEHFDLPNRIDPQLTNDLTPTGGNLRDNFPRTSVGTIDLAKWNNEIHSTDIPIGLSTYVADPKGNLSQFQNRLAYFEGGRINTKFRQAMEDQLDTYYVPFYFHDLRTNEILPLPVFVQDISDSYSPKWSEVEGYGRGDNVQIYGGTTRKIGFSFYMVATNEEDYSALYYGINKLVSMVYPQWGGAKKITNAKNQSFQVPYSYVPTASPLIRIRLGELFASNRAPENVRRLFGANLEDFTLGLAQDVDEAIDSGVDAEEVIQPDVQPDPTEIDRAAASKYAVIRDNAKSNFKVDGDVANVLIEATQLGGMGGRPFLNFAGCGPDGTGGIQNSDGKSVLLPTDAIITAAAGRYQFVQWNGVSYQKIKTSRFGVSDGSGLKWEVINYYSAGNRKRSERRGGYLKSTVYYVCQPLAGQSGTEAFDEVKDKVVSDDASAPKLRIGQPYVIIPVKKVVGVGKLKNPPPLIPNPFAAPPVVPIGDGAFFTDNSIVAAMEESGGMGLAGAITSLDFNWNEGTWETKPGLGRAPQYVKVTISFTPIHDEPLGLNPDGSLRAAAYPVGTVVEQTQGSRYELPGRIPRIVANGAARYAALKAEALEILAQQPKDQPSSDGV